MISDPGGRFTVDVVHSHDMRDLHLTLECQWCTYVGEMEAPIDLQELNRRADEHAEVCTDGTQ